MALDTAAKRSSVPGVGRPWMRGITPDATKSEAWRHSVGNTYAGFSFAAPVTAEVVELLAVAFMPRNHAEANTIKDTAIASMPRHTATGHVRDG